MILTVTLNPTLDRTVAVDGFELGGLLQVKESRYYPGGKGINVARILKLLGADVGAIIFEGGLYGEYIKRAVTEEGIHVSSVKIGGNTRSNVTIIDTVAHREAHMLESGPSVSSDEVAQFFMVFEERLRISEFVVLSGSLPVGVPEDIYAGCISKSQGRGINCALDTKGEPLRIGLAAKPFLIKPNRKELEEVQGEELSSVKSVIDAARILVGRGVAFALVSLGKDGVILVDKSGAWVGKGPEIRVVNSVGSGDALLAGFVFSYLGGEKVENAISLGMACGSVNCLFPTVGAFKLSDVEHFRKQVTVTRL